MDKYVLITGASEGIGLELSKTFASKGHSLILVARRENLLEQISADIIQSYSVNVITIACDLTSESELNNLLEKIQADNLQVNVLVNNAGIGDFSLFQKSSKEKNQYLINLNIQAVVSLTHGILPMMINNKEGYILNVASLAAFSPGPYIAVYAASKAFILSFSNALASELAEHNVAVSVLCPGDIKTGFQKNAGLEGFNVQSKISINELSEFTYSKFVIDKEWEIIPEETKKTIDMISSSGNRKSISENLYKMRRLLANKLLSSK